MDSKKNFFSLHNTIQSISDQEYGKLSDYLSVIDAFARATYKSIYVIDYEQETFEYVSNNPLFLCGHSPEYVTQQGYQFYFDNVIEEDLQLLLKINEVGFEFYAQLPMEERNLYTISYDFHLKSKTGYPLLINQKLTPIFITESGKIWKALCIVSLSNNVTSGNIKIFHSEKSTMWQYDMEANLWREKERQKLTEREIEVLHISAQGLKVSEIAEKLHISSDTVKFHKKKLFEKIGVSSISEAILYATNNKLI